MTLRRTKKCANFWATLYVYANVRKLIGESTDVHKTRFLRIAVHVVGRPSRRCLIAWCDSAEQASSSLSSSSSSNRLPPARRIF